MIEDYFYKDVPNFFTEKDLKELKILSEELSSQDKFFDLKNSDQKNEWNSFTHKVTDDPKYLGGAYGIRVTLLRGEGKYAWTEKQKELPTKLMNKYDAQGAQFLFIPPYEKVKKHIDTQIRACSISVPLTKNIAPTFFYESMNSEEPAYICKYDKPTLLNIQKPHSIQNNEMNRMVFQVSFLEPYETVREKLRRINYELN